MIFFILSFSNWVFAKDDSTQTIDKDTSLVLDKDLSYIINKGFTLSTAGDSTHSNVISGQGNLLISKSDTVTLGGSNTLTGLITVEGTLRVTSNDALGSTAVGTTVSNSGSLELSGAIKVSDPLTLNGTGNKSGGALRNISGNNTFEGAISLGANSRINSDSGTLNLNVTSGNAVTGTYNLFFGGSGNITVSDPIATSTGTLTKDGAGTLTLSATNTYSGTTTISAGTLKVSGSLNDSTAVTVESGATYTLGSSDTVGSLAGAGAISLGSNTLTAGGDNTSTEVSGIISGTGALTKSGTGTLTLSGTNTYSGSTTISAGTLVINGSGSIDSNTIEIDSGAILQVNVADSLSSGATITVTGTFDVNENNTILKLNGAGSTDIASGKTLTVASSSGFTGEFTGSGKLAFSGGTTTLKASNSHSGGTDISGGVVMIEDDTAVGSGKITLTGGKLSSNNTTARSLDEDVDIQGTIELGDSSNTGALTLGGTNRLTGNTTLTNDSAVNIAALSGSSDLSKSGSGTLTITGDSAYTGATTISNGKLRITGRIGSSGTYTGTVANSGEFEINSSDDQIMTGVISGTGTLKKDGSGTLTLRGVNTQTGLVTVSGGLLYAGTAADNGKTIVAGDVRVNGGTLGGGGTIGGNVNASGGSLAPGNSIGTLTIDGDLTLDSSSTTNIELDASSADKIIVNGTIDLDGALSLTVTNATYSDTTYTIIQGGTLSDGDTFASLVGGDSSNFNGGSASLSYDYDNNLVKLVITASSSSGSVRSNTSTNSLKTLADIFDNSTASTLSSLKTYWVSNSGVVDSELKEAKGTVLATSLVQAQKTHNAFQKAVSNVTSMGASSPVGNFTRSGSSNLSLAELQESGLYGDRNNWSEHYDYSDTSVLGFLKNNKNKTLVSAFTSNDSAAFIRTYGAKTKRDNIGSDYTGYQNDTYGILFGEQYKMSEGNFNGYSYGLSGSDTDYNDSYGESRTYSAHSSIFKQIDEKDHAVNLIAGGYLSHTSSKRNVSVGGGIVNDTYKSSTNDFGVNASAQYTKKIKLGGWQLSPSMSLQGSYEFKDDIN
ncbi:MAG: autotransporter-associated beta strand repeat-containing protein [Pelagibacteraceae bacterium]|nr:autotransporter-associated beta strand repeat-containing protein [Pelagibacteraceae bacterium]MCI5079089.1 autotransporter-associated beta strand repeat-containing protein [Pelagibacteraceae bacterium]